MVIPELHFIQIEREPDGGDAVMFEQFPLRIAPESFQAVDVDATATKPRAVIDREMAIATKGQGIVPAEFVGVDQRAPLHHLDRFLQQRFRTDVRHDGHGHAPPTLQDAKDRHFAGCSAPAAALPSAPKVRLVSFHLPPQELRLLLGQQRPPDRGKDTERGGITHPGLDRGLPSGDLQLEQFHQPHPGGQRHPGLAQPRAREQAEGVATAPTAIPATGQSIDPPAAAAVTKQAALFVASLPQGPQEGGPASNQLLKRLNPHGTSLNLVPDVLQSPNLNCPVVMCTLTAKRWVSPPAPQAGFTIGELMVVVGIMAFAVAIAVPNYIRWNSTAQL